jgi:hypothetical protein
MAAGIRLHDDCVPEEAPLSEVRPLLVCDGRCCAAVYRWWGLEPPLCALGSFAATAESLVAVQRAPAHTHAATLSSNQILDLSWAPYVSSVNNDATNLDSLFLVWLVVLGAVATPGVAFWRGRGTIPAGAVHRGGGATWWGRARLHAQGGHAGPCGLLGLWARLGKGAVVLDGGVCAVVGGLGI